MGSADHAAPTGLETSLRNNLPDEGKAVVRGDSLYQGARRVGLRQKRTVSLQKIELEKQEGFLGLKKKTKRGETLSGHVRKGHSSSQTYEKGPNVQ